MRLLRVRHNWGTFTHSLHWWKAWLDMEGLQPEQGARTSQNKVLGLLFSMAITAHSAHYYRDLCVFLHCSNCVWTWKSESVGKSSIFYLWKLVSFTLEVTWKLFGCFSTIQCNTFFNLTSDFSEWNRLLELLVRRSTQSPFYLTKLIIARVLTSHRSSAQSTVHKEGPGVFCLSLYTAQKHAEWESWNLRLLAKLYLVPLKAR